MCLDKSAWEQLDVLDWPVFLRNILINKGKKRTISCSRSLMGRESDNPWRKPSDSLLWLDQRKNVSLLNKLYLHGAG